jgi:hypothetical protein
MNVRFVMDEDALVQVFLPVLRYSPSHIIPLMLHTHLHLHAVCATETRSRTLGTSEHNNAFLDTKEHWTQMYLLYRNNIQILYQLKHHCV